MFWSFVSTHDAPSYLAQQNSKKSGIQHSVQISIRAAQVSWPGQTGILTCYAQLHPHVGFHSSYTSFPKTTVRSLAADFLFDGWVQLNQNSAHRSAKLLSSFLHDYFVFLLRRLPFWAALLDNNGWARFRFIVNQDIPSPSTRTIKKQTNFLRQLRSSQTPSARRLY